MTITGYEFLTKDNVLLYAAKYYYNPNGNTINHFHDDLKRIKHLKKLFGRFDNHRTLNERLIINHLIVLYNVFELKAMTNILFFYIEKKYWSYLKTFLIFLNYIDDRELFPEAVAIPVNQDIANKLRKI